MFDEKEYIMLDPLAYKNKISIMSKKNRTTIIPKYVQKMIVEKALNYIDNENQRAKIFLKELFKMKLSNTTIARHFKLIKPLLFPNTTILANSMAFDNHTLLQNKIPNFKNINNSIEYMKSTESNYKWAILLALYSGLRLNDIIKFKVSHITMLNKKQESIPLNTKNNGEWKVVYHDIFEDFINHLTQVTFKDECKFYLEYNIDLFLFQNISTSSLHCKLCEFYTLANGGENPPIGFGIHIYRYFLTSKLVQKEGIGFAEVFLGHKIIKSTEIYSNTNVNEYTDRLKAINNKRLKHSKIQKSLEETSLVSITKDTLM